jgi:hypothetical protein
MRLIFGCFNQRIFNIMNIFRVKQTISEPQLIFFSSLLHIFLDIFDKFPY